MEASFFLLIFKFMINLESFIGALIIPFTNSIS